MVHLIVPIDFVHLSFVVESVNGSDVGNKRLITTSTFQTLIGYINKIKVYLYNYYRTKMLEYFLSRIHRNVTITPKGFFPSNYVILVKSSKHFLNYLHIKLVTRVFYKIHMKGTAPSKCQYFIYFVPCNRKSIQLHFSVLR